MSPRYLQEIPAPGGLVGHLIETDDGSQRVLRDDDPHQAMIARRLKAESNDPTLMSAGDAMPMPPPPQMGGQPPPPPQTAPPSPDGPPIVPQNVPGIRYGEIGAPTQLQPAPPITGDIEGFIQRSDAAAAEEAAATQQQAPPGQLPPQQAAPRGLPMVNHPGQAARPAGFVPQARRTGPQTSGESQGLLEEARDRLFEVRKGQLEVKQEEDKAAAQAAYKQSLAQSVLVNEQAEAAEARANTIQQGHDEALAAVDRSREEADIKIDPDRYWKKKGIWGQIAARISMAIGGYLQGKQGGPNRAAQNIRQKIRDDIADQQQDWKNARSKHLDAKNRFSEYVKIHGTPEAATKHLEMVGLAQARAQAEQEAAAQSFFDPGGLNAKKAELAMQELVAQFDQFDAEAKAEFSRERTGTLTEAYDRGQGAIRGGQSQMTPQEYDKWLKTQVSIKEREGQLRGEAGQLEPKDLRKARVDYSRDLQSAGVPAYNAAIQKVYDALSEAEVSGDAGAGIGPVAGRAPNWLLTDAGSKVRAAIIDAGDRNLRDRSGAVVSEGEANREMLVVASRRSPEALRQALSSLASRSDSISTNLGRGYGAEVVDAYNREETERSKVQAGAGETLGFTPIE